MKLALLTTCLAVAVAGCVTDEVEKPRPLVNYSAAVLTQKSPDQLRQDLRGMLKNVSLFTRDAPYKGYNHTVYFGEWADTTIGTDGVSLKFSNAAPNNVFERNNPDPTHRYGFYYDELSDLTFDGRTCNTRTAPLPHDMTINLFPAVGPEVCNTLFSLGQHYKQQRETDAAAFAEQAARLRTMPVKPAMSENQRRLIVQAESQRQRKDYAGAADLFRTAIRMDPVSYPAAYFNLALLYEQQEQYGRAIDAMRKYLLLQSNAADARSAQDKIYEWELLARRK